MKPHRNWLCDYEELEGGGVVIGYDSLTKIIGRGKFQLILKDERKGTLSGVLHILCLDQNLISISRMGDVGVQNVFEKDTCKLGWGAMILMRGIKMGTLYKLLGRTDASRCHHKVIPKTNEISSCVANSNMLPHQWLGHNDEKGFCGMHNKGMVKVFPKCSFEFDFYEHCVYGKQNRVRLLTKATRSKIILELVHSDVFGPVSVPSLGGSRYDTCLSLTTSP